jgi:hypothetical protein
VLIPPLLPRCEHGDGIQKLLKNIQRGRPVRHLLHQGWMSMAYCVTRDLRAAIERWKSGELEFEDNGGELNEEAANKHIRRSIEDFLQSPEFDKVAKIGRDEVGYDLDMVLDYFPNYLGCLPEKARHTDIEKLMLEVLPRKISAEPEAFKKFAAELLAFYQYLARTGAVKNGERLLSTIAACAPKMVEYAANPENWGMAKNLVMRMFKDGVNPADEKAVQRWILEYNKRLLAHNSSCRDELP